MQGLMMKASEAIKTIVSHFRAGPEAQVDREGKCKGSRKQRRRILVALYVAVS